MVAFGFALLAFPGMGRHHLRALGPVVEARLGAGALAFGSGLVGFGLVSMSVPALLDDVGARHLAALCQRLIHDFLAGGHVGGGLAAALLGVLAFRAIRGWRRVRRSQRAAIIEPWVGHHRAREDYELVVLPTSEFVALTVGGAARQVVVSHGLVAALSDDQLTMVVRHELAHLRGGHDFFLAIAALVEAIFGWVPLVASSTHALRLAIERSADEQAAGADPVARRVLYSALAVAVRCHPEPGTASFGGADMVLDRLSALESNPRTDRSRWSYLALGVVASTAASLWLFSVVVVGVSLTSSGVCFY